MNARAEAGAQDNCGVETDSPFCANLVDQRIKGAFGEALLDDLLKERREDRRWKLVKRLGLTFIFVASFLAWALFYATSIGFKIMPRDQLVGVVKIEGAITDSSKAGADKLVPQLAKAFEAPNVEVVVLAIDSPGGQPQESERVNRMIEHYKAKTKKPVIAVINNVGASAAYMIAVHADKIIAGEYSVVGSIGAVLTGWDFHKALTKVDVSHRMFASGKHKGMLSPYVELSPESADKAQNMVNEMAHVFFDEVKARRAGKLKEEIDYFTGEVWGGREALALGLIDEIGTLEEYIGKHHDGLKVHVFAPSKNIFALEALSEVVVNSIATLVSEIQLQADEKARLSLH